MALGSRSARLRCALLGSLAFGCSAAPHPTRLLETPGERIAVVTPVDGIPIRSNDVVGTADDDGLAPGRERLLLALRSGLAAELRTRGFDVVEVDADDPLEPTTNESLAGSTRAAGAELTLTTELVVYGDIRRSWLWILAAQALVAGIGHGVVVAAATDNATYGWWAGAGEFALETVTWVGGALVGTRGIDPVLLRFTLVDSRDGKVVKRWHREATRNWRRWFRKKGMPPRDERLRAVADRIFAKFAPKLARQLDKRTHAAREPAPG